MAVDGKGSGTPLVESGSHSARTSSDASEEKNSLFSGGAAAVLVLILLILLPIFYVLSIGPVVWLEDRDYIEVGEVVVMFYAPLIYVHERAPTLAAPLDWYVRLWESSGPPQVTPYTPPTPVPAQIPMPVPAPGANPGSGGPGPAPPTARPTDETAPDLPATNNTPGGGIR